MSSERYCDSCGRREGARGELTMCLGCRWEVCTDCKHPNEDQCAKCKDNNTRGESK